MLITRSESDNNRQASTVLYSVVSGTLSNIIIRKLRLGADPNQHSTHRMSPHRPRQTQAQSIPVIFLM